MLHIQICTESLPGGVRYVAWFDHAIFEGESIPELAEKIVHYMVLFRPTMAYAVAKSTHITMALCNFDYLPPPEVYGELEGKPGVLEPCDRKDMTARLRAEAQEKRKQTTHTQNTLSTSTP